MANLDKKLLQQQNVQQPVQNSAPAAAAATMPAAAAAPVQNNHALNGVSQTTQDNLSKYTSGYTPSASVTQAQDYLNSIVSGKPGAYQNQYQAQLDSLYNQVMNRGDFTFDLNGNALYQMYKDQYMNQGKQAMMDTMGQAATLTGGYGNSYANTAGNQAYQSYLQKLNDVVPQLYQMELDRYNQAGENLLKQYQMTADLENAAYGKYRDTVADWNTERDFANADYLTRYEQDYQNYANMLNYWNQMAQRENAAYFDQQQMDMAQNQFDQQLAWNKEQFDKANALETDRFNQQLAWDKEQYGGNKELQMRELAYNQAMAILSAGKMPSNDLLSAAGISSADAKSLYNAYKKSSSGGSSRRRSSGGGYTPQPQAGYWDAKARTAKEMMEQAAIAAKEKMEQANAAKNQSNIGGMLASLIKRAVKK